MDPRTVTDLFAITLLAAAAVVAVGVFYPKARMLLAQYAPVIVAIAAVGATAGSLYLSEVAGYLPCKFCWYQRYAMYPMALIMPVAAIVRYRKVLYLSLLLGSAGLAVSIYHIQLQMFPDQASNSCDLTSPCTAKWVEAFGFMTIPQMAGITFAIIVAASLIGLKCRRQSLPSGVTGLDELPGYCG